MAYTQRCEKTCWCPKKVKKDGVVTEMCQGNYNIDRENPALKSYNTTIKNYQALIKQITDLLPNQNNNNGDDFDGDNLGDNEWLILKNIINFY